MPTKTYTKDDFTADVQAMTNRQLIASAASAILGAAIMDRFPRFNTGKDGALTDAIYDECVRRGNVDLYQRGFNDAVRSQGHTGMVKQVSTPISVGEEMRIAPPRPGEAAA